MTKANLLSFFTTSLAIGLLLAISGCAVGPNYHRPSAPAAPSFKEAPPEGWKQAQPNAGISRGKWWEIYNDPTLNAMEEQVNISNQNVLHFLALYREARDTVRIARSSYFPTITAGASVTNSRTSATLNRNNQVNFISGTNNLYSLPVDVSYQADVWGSIRRTVAANRDTAQASDADLENARLTFQAQLAEFYFELKGQDSQAALLRQTLSGYEQYLQLTQERLSVGVASGSDVAQAQTQYNTTQAQLIDIGVARAQFEHALAILMGKPPMELTIAPSSFNVLPPPVPVGLPSTLLERRPDIAAAERRIAAANEEIGVAKAAFFPTLIFSATGGLESTSLSKWIGLPSRFWSLGPQFTETLFSGGKRHAQVDFQEAAYDDSVTNYRQTVLTAFQQIEDNLAALRILEQEAAAQDKAVRSAQQSLAISTEQYKAGTTDYLQVITTQNTALQNEVTAVGIHTRRMAASVLLIEALGGGWDASQMPRNP
ncbi:MAG: efflux system, outer rane lipoprotein NodT family [Candidatus Angelobacter sp.]|nr:efflux system, outer rane lipoprotein NodT family [Candidatus Angelobacter sp.]